MPFNRHPPIVWRSLLNAIVFTISNYGIIESIRPPPNHSTNPISKRSLSNMCVVIDHIHQTCRHHRKRQGVQLYPQRAEAGICTAVVVAHTTIITKPALCPTCYRIEEDKVFDKYESKIRPLRERLDELKEAPKLPRLIEFYEGRYNEAIQQKKDKRMQKLTEFREAQGVWGDG